MAHRDKVTRRSIGNGLLLLGLLIVLGVGGYLGWTQVRAARVRSALEQNPAPTVALVSEGESAARPAATPTQVVFTLTPTAVPPSPTSRVPAAPPATPAATTAPAPMPATTPMPVPTAAPRVAQAGSPARLVFADLQIDARVVPMGWQVVQTASGPRSEWVIPKNDAGHHINSALLGQDDNLVISGHNNIYGQVFKPISLAWDNDQRIQVDSYSDRSDILTGRIITLFDAAGRSYQYTVTDFLRLKDTGVPAEQRVANARFMQPTGAAQLTIITCWPPTNNTHRLIVIAKPVQ